MSFRTWMHVAAIIGLTLSASQALPQATTEDEPSQGEAATDTQKQGQDHTQAASDVAAALESIEAAIRDLIAEEDKIAQDAQRDRENRDLNAQEGMAKWAEWMF